MEGRLSTVATFMAAAVLGCAPAPADPPAAGSASRPLALPESPRTGRIAGKVVDAKGAPVAGACVLVCDQATGVPLGKETRRPFTDGFFEGRQTMDLAFSVTGSDGQFAFPGVPAGRYRLIAQSWTDAESIKGLLEVNGKVVHLHGAADDLEVPSEAASEVVIRPLGTGALRIDEQIGNNETLLVVSTAPPRADPILGFAGWGGPFLRNMIGGNRMPYGETTIYGLPAGKVYLALFAADNNPGWGAGQAVIQPHRTTVAYVPIVASWSDGHHDPPDRLLPLVEEVRTLRSTEGFSLPGFLVAQGIDLAPQTERWQREAEVARHLEREIQLPSGTKTSLADLVAAARYVELQRLVREREAQAKRRAELAKVQPERGRNGEEVTYEEALVALFKELGRDYPCFELKGLDWMAVGQELLPRAKEVETEEQFGLLCLEMVARLEDSHAQLLPGTRQPPWPASPRWDPGFACLVDDRGAPVVYYVDQGGPADEAGVRIGMTVLSIDGKPADEAIEACMRRTAKYAGYSSRRYLRYQATRWFVRQMQRGATVRLEMQDTGGKRHTFNLPATLGVRYLPRLPVPISGVQEAANVSWTMLDDHVGYVYVRRIRADLIERLDRAVADLEDAKGLIVDVRGNSGGGFDSKRSHRNFAPDDPEEPERPRFRGPVALLVDARSISAGEGWASWFVANRRARLFGQSTAGASSRKRTYTLKNGLYKVTFPVKAYSGYLDRPIERRGLEPDVALMQNPQDLAAGRDTVLEAARRYLLETP
jgi:carboxyl-terminal processing protease